MFNCTIKSPIHLICVLILSLSLASTGASAAVYAVNAVIDVEADGALYSGGGRVQNEWNAYIDFGETPISLIAGDMLNFRIEFAGRKGLYLANANEGLGTQTLNLWFSTRGPIGSGFFDHYSRGEYSLLSAFGDVDDGPVSFASGSGPAFVSPSIYRKRLTNDGFVFGGIEGFFTVESLQVAWGDGVLTGVVFGVESDSIRVQALTPPDPTPVPLPGGLFLMGSALALCGTRLRLRGRRE